MNTQKVLNNKFTVIVKPNKKENKIVKQDTTNNTITVEIAALPEKNKANKKLIKFLTKHFGKKVRIKTGLTSKEKICEVTK